MLSLLKFSGHFRSVAPALKTARPFSSALQGSVVPVCIRAENHLKRTALVDQLGSHTYEDLLLRSRHLAAQIHKVLGPQGKNQQQRIAFICPNDFHYIVAQWATWLLGHIAVPLGKMHPTPQLEYYVQDSDCSVLLSTPDFLDKVKPIVEKRKSTKLLVLEPDVVNMASSSDSHVIKQDDNFYKQADAMFLYTSGTTGAPKGVVITHSNLEAQLRCITNAWNWTVDDRVLHVLPLHHVHGVVYLLLSPLYMGARCVMLPKFDPVKVWNHLLNPSTDDEKVSVFMGVPTVYVKLLEEFDKLYNFEKEKETIKKNLKKNIRLVVSGSASLPEPVFEKWTQITGSTIVERYGMSEIGLALSNPIDGPCIKGCVGTPLPTVEVLIAKDNTQAPNGYDVIATGDEHGTRVNKGMENESGELYVKGPSIFREYWNKPEATKKDFTKDGWFKTGDTVQFVNGTYKILGRTSVDIIKSGGYKISALDVETALLAHQDILEVTVVGVEDKTWGQRVVAVVMLKPGSKEMTLDDLRSWCKEKLPPYSIPSVLKVVPEIPRNILGKVNKKELVKTMFPQ